MSTDRELLELAAKASGFHYNPTIQGEGLWGCFDTDQSQSIYPWNPLEDDGDALRLAVELKIAIFPPENDEGDFVVASIEDGVLGDDGDTWIQEWVKGGDRMTATRRAIVRAAAEIGRSMP